MNEERMAGAESALTDEELMSMFRNTWRGMRHGEARRRAVQERKAKSRE